MALQQTLQSADAALLIATQIKSHAVVRVCVCVCK